MTRCSTSIQKNVSTVAHAFPECPVEAIYDEAQLPDSKQEWIQINADKAHGLPVITEQQEPAPGAEEKKEELGF